MERDTVSQKDLPRLAEIAKRNQEKLEAAQENQKKAAKLKEDLEKASLGFETAESDYRTLNSFSFDSLQRQPVLPETISNPLLDDIFQKGKWSAELDFTQTEISAGLALDYFNKCYRKYANPDENFDAIVTGIKSTDYYHFHTSVFDAAIDVERMLMEKRHQKREAKESAEELEKAAEIFKKFEGRPFDTLNALTRVKIDEKKKFELLNRVYPKIFKELKEEKSWLFGLKKGVSSFATGQKQFWKDELDRNMEEYPVFFDGDSNEKIAEGIMYLLSPLISGICLWENEYDLAKHFAKTSLVEAAIVASFFAPQIGTNIGDAIFNPSAIKTYVACNYDSRVKSPFVEQFFRENICDEYGNTKAEVSGKFTIFDKFDLKITDINKNGRLDSGDLIEFESSVPKFSYMTQNGNCSAQDLANSGILDERFIVHVII